MSTHGQGGRTPKWPDPALEILRSMWANPDLSASVIADTINAAEIPYQTWAGHSEPLVVTRNAVIGRARRDPLCEAREMPKELQKAKAAVKPKGRLPFQHEFRHLPMHAQMRELGPGRCQYTQPNGWTCCGMPVMGPGKPWCAEHYAVVFPRTVKATDLVKQAKIGTWGQ